MLQPGNTIASQVAPSNAMHSLVHPAIAQLFLTQTVAKVRRMRQGFSTPRRFLLSCVGLVLGVVYASNIVISVYLRKPMESGRFETYVSLGLLAYVLWDLVKNACRQPDEALIWSRVERERLQTSPFSRRDILSYRFAGVTLAAGAKAILFATVMFVDIPIFGCGLFGALMALVFVDLLRMIVSITAFSTSRRTFHAIRVVVVAMVAVLTVIVFGMAWKTLGTHEDAAAGSIKFMIALGQAMIELGQSSVGNWLAAPFTIFSSVMTTETITWAMVGRLLAAVLMVGSAGWAVIRLDEYFHADKLRDERANFAARRHQLRSSQKQTLLLTLNAIGCYPPIVTLAWRQAVGARPYWGSLLIALTPPTIFSFLPLTVNRHSTGAFFAVVGSLAFYSFVLLPSALKFDFRTDFHRMSVLKSLPLRPATIVCGQLACPVIITTIFQLLVVAIAAPLTANSCTFALGAMLIMLPLNVFIFALDNLIFLLYPHPLKQEGIATFARTTLTFTGKGLLFGVALVVMVSWAYCSAALARTFSVNPRLVFVAGLGLLLAAISLTSLMATIWAYRRFDPCQDAVLD